MEIVKENPPNYKKISKKFKLTKSVVFTYGDKIYVPNGEDVSPHLMAHEETHMRQQGDNPEAWWDKYLEDEQFRLEQELEAYRNQFRFVRKKSKATRKQRSEFLDNIASDLSSPIYGNIIDYKTARNLIRK